MTEARRSFLGDLALPSAPQEHVQSIPSASKLSIAIIIKPMTPTGATHEIFG